MKKIYIWFFLLLVLSSGGIGYLYFNAQKNELISPVLGVSRTEIAENVWLPKEFEQSSSSNEDKSSSSNKESLEDTEVAQKVTAKSAFFIELESGEVMFAKNPLEKLSIASLTKIMTTIVVLERKNFDNVYQVSQHAADMEPDKMLLIAGERLKLEELLQGMFLVSANDAAEVIAEGTIGNRDEVTSQREGTLDPRTEFIDLMNKKAIQLGMLNTHFVNPTGLEEDPPAGRAGFNPQYSTAFDVSLMSRYAIKTYPKLLEISSQPHIFISSTADHQDYDLYSGINLLTTYPGVLGFKTGYTPEAGLTLVTVAKKGEKTVLGVLLGSTNRRDDAKLLLDYSFSKLGFK